jgi:feruloyl esterase
MTKIPCNVGSGKGRCAAVVAVVAALLLSACTSSSGSGQNAAVTLAPVMACADLASQADLPDTTIKSATLDAGGSASRMFPDAGPEPENCVVEGEIGAYTGVTDPDTGSSDYGINFELRMPTRWNGRFFYQGGGGADGVLTKADGLIPSEAGNLPGLQGLGPSPQTPALWRGFAVVSSDAGHHSSNLVSGFGVDPTARVNYGYASIGQVTPIARQIIARYFGRAPRHSYFLGCSKGGQEAMQASQKYGDQFDGIVAGDPGFHLPHAAIAEAWNTQALAKAAQARAPSAVDANGNPLLYKAFSSGDLDLIRKGVAKACDALDGVEDGMVFNLQACAGRFDPASLQCKGAKTANCLSPAQVTAVQAIFGGARDSNGNAVYVDFPYDTGIGSFNGWPLWDLGLPLGANLSFNTTLAASSSRYIFTTPPDPALSMFIVDIDAYVQAVTATSGIYTASAVDFMEADSTNLDAFRSHGGKIIFIHGGSDPVFSMNDTIAYYDRLGTAYGSGTQKFALLFLVPGMNHCVGGDYATDTFDTLDAIVDWVEHDRAPALLLAHSGSPSSSKLPAGTTRPLCAYPRYARYNGSGDANDAANYSCAAQ